MKTRKFHPFFIFLPIVFFLTGCEGFLGGNDPADKCASNRKVVYQSGELLVEGSSMWLMNIANLNGAIPNADKDCHAQLTLEFWFKDKVRAKTDVPAPTPCVVRRSVCCTRTSFNPIAKLARSGHASTLSCSTRPTAQLPAHYKPEAL